VPHSVNLKPRLSGALSLRNRCISSPYSHCMSLGANIYRQKAAEATRSAAQAKNPSLKRAFEDVARGCAEQSEWTDNQKLPPHGSRAAEQCDERAPFLIEGLVRSVLRAAAQSALFFNPSDGRAQALLPFPLFEILLHRGLGRLGGSNKPADAA
jgi:hypothetical protein